MADVFEVLRADHGDVRLLLAALESSPGHAAGASPQVLKARKLAAERLVIDSSRHEAAEEEYFWPAVRERLGDGSRLADEASAQEQAGRAALARLDQLEPDDDEFDELLTELIPAARRHIEFEETRVWPQLRQALSPFQARELGDQIREATERATARPQPRGTARPKGRKTAGSAAAAAGKLSSAATRRRSAS
ncbi:MAG: hemerythrin domain-containing protein [Streptosporangiaceae bacterium]